MAAPRIVTIGFGFSRGRKTPGATSRFREAICRNELHARAGCLRQRIIPDNHVQIIENTQQYVHRSRSEQVFMHGLFPVAKG
jgi:hypothetical protein